MTTFKKLADRVRAFNRDEEGASTSIEQIGALAVGVIILGAVLTVAKEVLEKVKTNMINLVGG